MQMFLTLISLQINLIRNEFTKDNLLKPIFSFGSLLLLMVVFGGFGYSLGYLMIYSNKIKPAIDSIAFLRSIEMLIVLLIIANLFSQRRCYKQLTYKHLRFMPLQLYVLIGVDFLFSSFNRINLFIASLLIGLSFCTSSIDIFFLLKFILIFTLIAVIHLFVVLVDSVFNILRTHIKLRYMILITSVIIVLTLILLPQIKIENAISESPIGWSTNEIVLVNSEISFPIILQSILINLICLFCGSLIYILVKLYDYALITKNSKTISPKFGLFNIALKILEKDVELFGYLSKELKCLIRSNRTGSQIVFELFFVVLIVYNYYFNLNIFPRNIYFQLFLAIVFPVLLWDFFLSNQFGLDKKGFKFYLYSPIDFKKLILSKNYSYLIVKIPTLILSSILFSYFIDIKLLPFIILLQLIVNTLMITIGNYNSIKYPSPSDVSENILSQKSPNRFSMIGFLGLLFVLIFSSFLLFLLWFYHESINVLFIFLVFTAVFMLIYKLLFQRTLKFLNERKEDMCRRLTIEE